MSTLFTKIIKGEIPCHKVAEDESYFAFLDISPLKAGHTLVIPKKEIDYIFDMEQMEYQGLMKFAKTLAVAIKMAFPCKKIGMSVVGLEVPHAHIHLIPINGVSDMNFSATKMPRSTEQLNKDAALIKSFL